MFGTSAALWMLSLGASCATISRALTEGCEQVRHLLLAADAVVWRDLRDGEERTDGHGGDQ
jgi:ribosomal protein S9